MRNILEKLNDSNWSDYIDQISPMLEKEIQQSKGGFLIKSFRENHEEERIKKIKELKNNFINNSSIETIDEDINELTSDIFLVNEQIQILVKFDLLRYLHQNREELHENYPNSVLIAKIFFDENDFSQIIKSRAVSIFNSIVFVSARQSSVSNSGNAGELFVDALLQVAGLIEGETYKRQHKSESGSDTDFVTPYVEDKRDQDVENFIAVQFSTNDRLRMVVSEIKTGGKGYIIVGNGLDASSKGLNAIGHEILNSMKEKNIQTVCFNKERERMLEKLKDKDDKGSKIKLDYFRDYSMGFSDFAKKMNQRHLN